MLQSRFEVKHSGFFGFEHWTYVKHVALSAPGLQYSSHNISGSASTGMVLIAAMIAKGAISWESCMMLIIG